MVRIPLSRGKFAIIDDCDIPLVNVHLWYAAPPRGRITCWYAQSKKPGSQSVLLLHRFILDVTNPDILVDHWNRDGLDNRRENLRLCDLSFNCGNQRLLKSNNTSGFKGVSFARDRGKYVAQIVVRQKHYCLGYFDDAKQAARAYDLAALEAFGEFAFTNAERALPLAQIELDSIPTLERPTAPLLITNNSGYRGVSFKNATNSWVAQIGLLAGGKKHKFHLGLYSTPEASRRTYERALVAKRLFGEAAGPFIQLSAAGAKIPRCHASPYYVA